MTDISQGQEMHNWVRDLFPICRSLAGPGTRETLSYLSELLPDMQVHGVPSGSKVFDWTVPEEWHIREAYIEDESGQRIVDFRNNNLHVISYSTPVDEIFSLDELQSHLHSLPKQPNAIPYITSYYSRVWGFCITDEQRKTLKSGQYRVVIDSEFVEGTLDYGELILPGKIKDEVLLSTYICHPSMANNELSGPAVTTALARWLMDNPNRRYTYRIIFIPETIGSIAYLSKHADYLKKNVRAGFVITCVGDDRTYSFVPSRMGGTLADRIALHALKSEVGDFDEYSFLDRGSDERQYCSPGIDLPVVSIMRSKYGEYPEYHTSLDDLSLVTPEGLQGGFDILKNCIEILEANHTWKATTPCEPQLGNHGLYPPRGSNTLAPEIRNMKHLLAYADGKHELIDIAEIIGVNALDCRDIADLLAEKGLLREMHK